LTQSQEVFWFGNLVHHREFNTIAISLFCGEDTRLTDP